MAKLRSESETALLSEALKAPSISQCKLDGEFKNSYLIHFIANNDEDAAIQLLRRSDLSSFINAQDGQTDCRNSALLLAIKRGFYDLAIQLIKQGADVSLVDAEGANAFHYACYLRHDALLKALCESNSFKTHKHRCLEQTISISIRDSEQYPLTPLDLYLLDCQPNFLNKEWFKILWNMSTYRLDEHQHELDSRAPVSAQGLSLLGANKSSLAMYAFAEGSRRAYQRNQGYGQDQWQHILDQAKQLTAAQYDDLDSKLSQLKTITNEYMAHLNAGAVQKKSIVTSLLSHLDNDQQSPLDRLIDFKEELSKNYSQLVKHRVDHPLLNFLRDIFKLLGIKEFAYSQGQRFVEDIHLIDPPLDNASSDEQDDDDQISLNP